MHQSPVRSICWLPDDTGFVSSAFDSTVKMVLLNPKEGDPNPVWEHLVPNVDQTCVKIYKPDDAKKPMVFVTSQDKSIRMIVDGNETCRYE